MSEFADSTRRVLLAQSAFLDHRPLPGAGQESAPAAARSALDQVLASALEHAAQRVEGPAASEPAELQAPLGALAVGPAEAGRGTGLATEVAVFFSRAFQARGRARRRRRNIGQRHYEEQQRQRSIAALRRRAADLGFAITPTAVAAPA